MCLRYAPVLRTGQSTLKLTQILPNSKFLLASSVNLFSKAKEQVHHHPLSLLSQFNSMSIISQARVYRKFFMGNARVKMVFIIFDLQNM